MNDSLQELSYKILLAILVGLLIGIERERRKREGDKAFAGIRTYPMISMLGMVAALLVNIINVYVYIAIFFGFSVLISISYFFAARRGDIGGTTEISMIVVFLMGSLIYHEFYVLAGIITVVIMILLTFKTEFHSFAGKIEKEDLFAAIKFAVITIIVLPLLPNETFGPLDVLNPRKIWYMVILIAGISFIGYILTKLVDSKKGIQLLSILGGIASSTAVTLSFTARSKEIPSLSRNFAAGIVLASTIMFPRVLLIIFVLNKSFAESLAIPFGIFTFAGLSASFILWRSSKKDDTKDINLTNPFKLLFAIKFGVLFAAILFISKAAQEYIGDKGIYITSFFAGFADVDAIALFIVNLVETNLALESATLAVVIATLANSLVKTTIAATFGSKELRKYSSIGFSFILIGFIVYVSMIW